ncbi:GNAT family N-acetyltransferase [Granulicatella sp. zg-ZJ]|uniref:GNAT family N-acetyltransferase n=1 Tax=unclassified Granulicatella TaxID=2630493 RepID=UPI0013C24C0C|nr:MULTISPECIES: GNAT family protein [unclassified Granulicatella]MBS4750001.1 GNAT family N-acetyltransferase [Carnobacteriaceae bacterium zg-ZUI78]NEW63074.1 GNAT family N-acetyltransferase [Granulicatella sp. zg-ZJ]NEW66200.1 GNAT family N-acetyltransferase [Granulicatella sp. zg-84]QMI86044.1 GNAT family N-acetyltransferase [Carnobacteriaceae bacterium zg-84]
MLEIKPIEEKDVYHLWKIGFSKADMEWTKWNGPYFEDYEVYTFETFQKELSFYKNTDYCWGIYVDDTLIGALFRHWEYQKTRWLEIGIVIYDENYWNGGYGTEALRLWIPKTFKDFPEIEHIGLTTWSGNKRMMRASEKLGLLQEACIRKVRYWQGVYYDSVKYGVLRDEWDTI